MKTLLRAFALSLVLIGTACHKTELPSIDGMYVMPDGQIAQLKEGRFTGTMVGRGTYHVEQTHVVLRLDEGPRLEGERLDADHFQITSRDGQSIKAVDLFRDGTPGAEDGKRRLAARLGHPIESDAERDAKAAAVKSAVESSAFSPDPSVPVERYQPLDRADALDRFTLAHAAPAPTDEQILNTLVPGYAKETDAFKKKDLAAALPTIREQLEATRNQHYFSVPITDHPLDMRGASNGSTIGPYDLSKKAFPIPPFHQTCFDDIIGSNIRVTTVRVACWLPVPDETVARRIEAARAGTIRMALEGRLYFAVTRAAPLGSYIPAEVLHAHVAIGGVAPDMRAEQDLEASP